MKGFAVGRSFYARALRLIRPCCVVAHPASFNHPRHHDRISLAMLGAQVAIHHLNQEATSRGARMLRTALGPAIELLLDDASVVEVMLNPDGRLDNTLSPPPSTNGINYFLPRRNGKVIISNGGSFTQLDGDGSIDSSFKFELQIGRAHV